MSCLRLTLAIVAVAFSAEVRAQYDVLFSHYYDMETSFNPAAAGKEAKMNITAAYAMDMAGFEHNPQTAYIAADMPVMIMNSVHGVGLQFMNDKLGLFNHMRISAQYSAKLRIFGGQLGIGIQAGLLSETFDGSKADLEDSSDPAFTRSEVNGNTLDIGAGLYYKVKDFYLGLSAQHLTAPKVLLGEVNEIKIDATYYATAGYTIHLRNPLLQVKTSAIGRTDGVMWRADVTGRLIYTSERKSFYGGLSYSPTNSVTLLLGTKIHGINVGYSYEVYTNGMSIGNGSHELFIGYQMDLNLIKKGKNMHKAVRIL
ncbi:MAG: type IX secretion system membrane protein PorP/SprF [Prevotella sp.]